MDILAGAIDCHKLGSRFLTLAQMATEGSHRGA
jgi:lectin, mannose-binding 2